MEDFLKDLLEFNSGERKKGIKEAKNSINKILDNCNCLLCVTNVGIISAGTGAEIMSLIAMAIDGLKNQGIPNNVLKEIIEVAIDDEKKEETEEKNSKDNNIEKLKEIKKCIDDLTNLLEKED